MPSKIPRWFGVVEIPKLQAEILHILSKQNHRLHRRVPSPSKELKQLSLKLEYQLTLLF
jgi:hypothetical protein